MARATRHRRRARAVAFHHAARRQGPLHQIADLLAGNHPHWEPLAGHSSWGPGNRCSSLPAGAEGFAGLLVVEGGGW